MFDFLSRSLDWSGNFDVEDRGGSSRPVVADASAMREGRLQAV